MKKIIFNIFLLVLVFNLNAQDIHFSQNTFSPLNLNPALTGAFSEDIRMMGSYRSQWSSVPVPYLTFSGAGDMKIPTVFRNNDQLSLAAGILFNYDKSGDSELTISTFGIMGSVGYQINDNNTISVGVQSAATQRAFSMSALRFNNQFNGDIFQESLDSRENFVNDNINFVDVAAGANWRYSGLKRTRHEGNFGFGLFHLNGPDVSFNNGPDTKLPIRAELYSIATIEVNPKWDVLVRAVGSLQGTQDEILVGTAGRYHLSNARGKKYAIQFGSYFRVGDAVIPAMELHYNDLKVGVSYDINISDFQEATNKRGGLEVGVIYTITNVKAVDVFESCPVF